VGKRKRTRPGSAYDRGVRVQTTVSPKAAEIIDALLATGLFGLNRALVVQELIYRSLRSDDVCRFVPLGRAMARMPPLDPPPRTNFALGARRQKCNCKLDVSGQCIRPGCRCRCHS
jgi:hypothetical protein